MRRALGIATFFGMIGVTAFGLIFSPVFYVMMRGLAPRRSRQGGHGGTLDTTVAPTGSAGGGAGSPGGDVGRSAAWQRRRPDPREGLGQLHLTGPGLRHALAQSADLPQTVAGCRQFRPT